MSFLSAAFLFALPLVAVPIAIHLYRGRRRDVILWGAMQFLAAAAIKGRRMGAARRVTLDGIAAGRGCHPCPGTRPPHGAQYLARPSDGARSRSGSRQLDVDVARDRQTKRHRPHAGESVRNSSIPFQMPTAFKYCWPPAANGRPPSPSAPMPAASADSRKLSNQASRRSDRPTCSIAFRPQYIWKVTNS